MMQSSNPGTAQAAVFEPPADAFLNEKHWDGETDVIVVGSGAAGGAAAVKALMLGVEVVVFEKAATWGGTTGKSGGVTWVPNNRFMRTLGIRDEREDAIRLMARTSHPDLYQSQAEFFGLGNADYDLLAAYYDKAASVIDELSQVGALKMQLVANERGQPIFYDYSGDLPENRSPAGRAIEPVMQGAIWGGASMVKQLRDFVTGHKGGSIFYGHRVTNVIAGEAGDVIGVEVTASDGVVKRFRARGGIVFGSGGFSHNPAFVKTFLSVPVYGSCAVPTDEGDIIPIATGLGAELGNMANAWWAQVILEDALKQPALGSSAFTLGGRSMFVVNRLGKRVVDEHMVYNERCQIHGVWDARRFEHINKILFMILDKVARREIAAIPPYTTLAANPDYLLEADTLEALASKIDERLQGLSSKIGDIRLDADFSQNLIDTKERFNRFAQAGVDEDFHRGGNTAGRLGAALMLMSTGGLSVDAAGKEDFKDNVKVQSMLPLQEQGPFYALLLGGGTIGTKGGPKINELSEILKVDGTPIKGLYGAGNCIASAAGAGYVSGGITIGLGLVGGYVAAEQAALRTKEYLPAAARKI